MNELNVPAYSPAVRLSYRIRVDGAAIVLEFPLRTDGLPKIAEHVPRAQLPRPSPGSSRRSGGLLEAR